ncbi:S-crystallin SL11-like [Acanthaster planci]|uniref:S-crystallin SL11-like n=1 Tax=Acanthaster planci TaxID=133434 RepID=A0A8B7Y4J6_ACAPL|nr:S-crystallin SL11-like [Acanthaster planci]
MPSYKLTYFDVRGRAETIRMLFAVAGQKFEDVRITEEQWPETKKKVPLGALPVLEIDGKQLIQSKAIASYLAREFGFYGANSWESAKIDEISGAVEDIWLPYVRIIISSDDKSKKDAEMKKHFEEKAPVFLRFLEDQLCKNNEGDGFFVGKKISMADLNFHTSIESLETTSLLGLEKYPKLTALKARISAHDKLAPYLAKRAKTDI